MHLVSVACSAVQAVSTVDRATFPCPSRSSPMAPRFPLVLVGALLAVALGAVPCESAAAAPRLRGSVACLDCAAGHDLSGVVVAVKCAGNGDGGGAGMHAAQTDGGGNFDVAVPGASASSASQPCAARVLGATEQLCAPQRLTVARVVPARARAPGSAAAASYVLGSRLAFFTRCAAATGSSAVATTMAADRDHHHNQGNAPPEPELRPTAPAVPTPVSPPPFAGGGNSPPFGFGGLPLIVFFPFIPIIGIP